MIIHVEGERTKTGFHWNTDKGAWDSGGRCYYCKNPRCELSVWQQLNDMAADEEDFNNLLAKTLSVQQNDQI